MFKDGKNGKHVMWQNKVPSFFGKYKVPSFFGKEPTPEFEYEELRLRLLQHIEHIEDKDHQMVMKSEMEQLGETDGFSKWRQQESETLSSIVQSAITRQQNPSDCLNAKKMVCHMSFPCGLACIMQQAAYCLLTAFATKRVLIFSDKTWGQQWDSKIIAKNYFSPLSSTCMDFEGPANATWQVLPNDTTRVIEFLPDLHSYGIQFHPIFYPQHDSPPLDEYPPYDPPALPTVLVKRISRLIRDPDAWWIGQFAAYIMRPNETVKQLLTEAEQNVDFSSPIVGVHVRRNDKVGTEAAFHNLEEYMEQVELWFIKYEMSHPPTKRRIYLASDDPQALQECREKYPQYEVHDNPNNAAMPNPEARFNDASVLGIIQDIHMLSLTNFVVCTMTSNVGSLIYQLLHYKHGDASDMVHSLDVPWLYLFRPSIMFQATVEDLSTNLKKGDELKVDTSFHAAILRSNQTHVDTYNLRTQEDHTYPLYKLKRILKLYDFPLD